MKEISDSTGAAADDDDETSRDSLVLYHFYSGSKSHIDLRQFVDGNNANQNNDCSRAVYEIL